MAKNKSSTSDVKVQEVYSSPSKARPNDVYIGRGNKAFVEKNHSLYMNLIREHTKNYFENTTGCKKTFIKDRIVNVIRKNDGNFFTNQCTREFRIWKVASEDSVIRKIKLALMAESMNQIAKERQSLGNQISNNVTKKRTLETSNHHHQCRPTINHSNKRPYRAMANSTLLTSSVPINILIDAALSRAKSLIQQNSPIPSLKRTRFQQKTTLYINERTGHLLNVASPENNLYHDLLIRYAGPFQELFGKSDALWNDDRRICFVWHNIVSPLQRSESFHIVLCPDSEQSIDVDPNDLQLTNPNRSTYITFRTIRAIIAALSDLRYIATEQAKKKEKIERKRRILTNSLEKEVMQMRAQQMQHLVHCDSLVPILQQQQQRLQQQQQQMVTKLCFRANQQDPVMVSDGSSVGDPQTTNGVAPAVRSRMRNLQCVGEWVGVAGSRERQHLERLRYAIADAVAIENPVLDTNTAQLATPANRN